MCEGYCDFYYDENIGEFVCRKCGYVLTKEDKRKALEVSNRLLKADEDDGYPCYGHDCFDADNYHYSCIECPLHKKF